MRRVGIVGCGNIAPRYVGTLKQLGQVEVVAFADGVPERANAFAAEHGGRALSFDDLLVSDDVDVVVNLTPASAHAVVTQQILEAGKSVFSEKPLATTLAEGRALVELADSKGLHFGCAPDTFLGAGLQAARAAIDAGVIGRPIGATAFMLSSGPERWHPNPEIFYVPGAGPLFDMGPYYFTTLVNLLGRAASLVGVATTGNPDRVCGAAGRVGDVVRSDVATHTTSAVTFESGAVATFVCSFDVQASRHRNIEIYGTEGTLAVPDPNTFTGPLQIRESGESDWRDLDLPTPSIPQERGIGLADMCEASRLGRDHRASASQALHVLDLMDSTLASSTSGARVEMTTAYARPAPLPAVGFD